MCGRANGISSNYEKLIHPIKKWIIKRNLIKIINGQNNHVVKIINLTI